jgi:uncharacterized protein YggE
MEAANVQNGTLTLMGEGQVRVRPDLARIDLGVLTTAKTAQEAVARNAQLMTQVANRVRGLGIPSEDLHTTGFTISPIVDTDDKSPTFNQIIAYQVQDTLAVRADIGKAARVIDEGVSAGVNMAANLSFGLRDEAPLRQQALQGAVRAARRDAEVLAHAMGVMIKGIQSAEVLFGGNPMIVRTSIPERASTPFEPGTLNLSASVRMVFEFGPDTAE